MKENTIGFQMSDAAAVPEQNESDASRSDGDIPGYPSIIIQGAALARIEAEMAHDTEAEVGGVLVGNAAPSTNFVLVTGSLAAPRSGSDSAPATDDEMSIGESVDDTAAAPSTTPFTFTAATLEAMAQQVADAFPGQRIVGWYHSHPSFGIFLSAHDLYMQSAFFAQPWQVGYVFDPVQAQRGFFGWDGREVVRVPQWEVTAFTHGSGSDLPVNTPAHSTASPMLIGGGLDAPVGGARSQSGAFGQPTGSTNKKRPIGAIIAAVAAAIAVVIAVVVISSGDDDTTAPTSTATENSSATDTESTPVDVETTEPIVVAETVATDAASTTDVTTTTAAPDSATTEPTPITFPDTPTAVQTPTSRLGADGTSCVASADGSYEPLTDCFVPLSNGNVLVFTSGSLRCTDPSGTVLAAEAQKFVVGVDADPLVLVVDDALIPTCTNLDYAKNVLSGGSDTLDGLCGSSGTQINDGTRRCLSHNLNSGAMVALVRSTENDGEMVASCVAAGTEKVVSPITWSADDVGTNWRIVSVVFDTTKNEFVATATREGATATANITCG